MKVEFKIGEIEAVASTDIVMPRGISVDVEAGINACMFTRLTSGVKAIVVKLIEAKYNKGSEVKS